MKSKLTKLISLAMALTLVASLAACGTNNEEETTTGADATTEAVAGETSAEETAAGETEAESTEVATEIVTDKDGNTQVVTEKPADKPAKPGDKTTKPADKPATPGASDEKLPTDKAALIAMFNAKTFKSAKMSRTLTSGKISAVRGTINLDLSNEQGVKDAFNKTNASIAVGNTKLTNVASASASGTMKSGTITFTLPNVNRAVATSVKHGHNGYLYFIDLPEASKLANDILAALIGGSCTVKGDKSYVDLTNGKIVATVKDGKVVSAKYTFSEHVEAAATYMMLPATANISGNGSVIYS